MPAEMRLMRRRDVITLIGNVVTWPVAARAQQATAPVIGSLYGTSAEVLVCPCRPGKRLELLCEYDGEGEIVFKHACKLGCEGIV